MLTIELFHRTAVQDDALGPLQDELAGGRFHAGRSLGPDEVVGSRHIETIAEPTPHQRQRDTDGRVLMDEDQVGTDFPDDGCNPGPDRPGAHVESRVQETDIHPLEAGQQFFPVIGETLQFGIEEDDRQVVLRRHPVEDVDSPRGQMLKEIDCFLHLAFLHSRTVFSRSKPAFSSVFFPLRHPSFPPRVSNRMRPSTQFPPM